MFLPDGARLGQGDVMAELWPGKPAIDCAPTIEPLVIDGEPEVKAGAKIRAR